MFQNTSKIQELKERKEKLWNDIERNRHRYNDIVDYHSFAVMVLMTVYFIVKIFPAVRDFLPFFGWIDDKSLYSFFAVSNTLVFLFQIIYYKSKLSKISKASFLDGYVNALKISQRPAPSVQPKNFREFVAVVKIPELPVEIKEQFLTEPRGNRKFYDLKQLWRKEWEKISGEAVPPDRVSELVARAKDDYRESQKKEL